MPYAFGPGKAGARFSPQIDALSRAEVHHGDMSTATFHPGTHVPYPRQGATATGAAPHPAHLLGNALRVVRVFAGAFFSVTVLGEYAEEAGVHRHEPQPPIP
jgi:hypothetical protein